MRSSSYLVRASPAKPYGTFMLCICREEPNGGGINGGGRSRQPTSNSAQILPGRRRARSGNDPRSRSAARRRSHDIPRWPHKIIMEVGHNS